MARTTNVPLVVLAAGLSSRMGRTKATLPLGQGDTFLTRILRSAVRAGVPDAFVVVGHDAESVRAITLAHNVTATFVNNPLYQSGQFSSVLAALTAIEPLDVDGMLLTLVDVPLVAPATIRAVLDRYEGVRPPVVRAVRGAEHGHPVLIDRSLFDEVKHSRPSEGLKPVVRAHASTEGDVEVEDEGAFFDIDTPDAYERARMIVGQE